MIAMKMAAIVAKSVTSFVASNREKMELPGLIFMGWSFSDRTMIEMAAQVPLSTCFKKRRLNLESGEVRSERRMRPTVIDLLETSRCVAGSSYIGFFCRR
jgi:hypothetical protein